jgi:hypothetical protein
MIEDTDETWIFLVSQVNHMRRKVGLDELSSTQIIMSLLVILLTIIVGQ